MLPVFLLQKSTTFKDFLDFVTENRRRDVDKSLSVIAETSKLIGNSAYGIQLINKSKFRKTLFVDERKVDQKSISPKFRTYDIVDEKINKINMAKRKIVHDEPILVGFTVLKNGKQRMLRLSRQNYETKVFSCYRDGHTLFLHGFDRKRSIRLFH